MRAHFLTAETADALFIIVDRRISAAVIKADSFPFHRAALDADASFFTFFFYDIGAALEDPEDLEQVEGSFFAGFAAVDVEVWISVLSFQFFQKRDRSLASSTAYSCYIYQDDLTFQITQ